MFSVFASLLAAIGIGLPIAVALGVVTVIFLWPTSVPLAIIPLQMFAGMENFVTERSEEHTSEIQSP